MIDSTEINTPELGMLSQSTFLVTGAAGFIGSNIVGELVRLGARKIVLLDNLSTGFMVNINEFLSIPSVEFIQGDIREENICNKVCEGIDFVIHLAALGSIPRSIENPIDTNAVNVDGFLNMLNAARKSEVKKFIFASSSSVYGDDNSELKLESHIGNPLSPYAVTKVANELYAEVFFRTYGLNTIGLRFFNVFGPKQNINGPYAAVIPLFVSRLLKGESCVIYGDGENTRDFTYVDNVINGVVKVVLVESKNVAGKIFNIACGESVSVNELYKIISTKLGISFDANHVPPRQGEIKSSLADVSEARNNFAYRPTISVEEGVNLTVSWYKNQLQ
jgi:UDP-N-acetylglucosamine 4-epimerase